MHALILGNHVILANGEENETKSFTNEVSDSVTSPSIEEAEAGPRVEYLRRLCGQCRDGTQSVVIVPVFQRSSDKVSETARETRSCFFFKPTVAQMSLRTKSAMAHTHKQTQRCKLEE